MKKIIIIFICLIIVEICLINMRYEVEIGQQYNYINELENTIQEKNNRILEYDRALTENINIYFDECYLEE